MYGSMCVVRLPRWDAPPRFSMGFDAPDLRREMKRRFAEGNYRGALELAERVLAENPDDAIAEAIATESRQEIARLQGIFAAPDSSPLGPGSSPLGGGSASDDGPASAYAVDIDIDEDVELDDATDEAAPSTKPPPSTGSRPTAPPGVSRSTANMPVVHVPTPAVPPVDDLDAAWDAPGSIPPRAIYEETPSADATVALSGADLDASLAALERVEASGQLTAEAADALARRMYEQFVGHEYAAAIETAKKILSFSPQERLALAIESQSRTALARERAIVVLVVPRASLSSRNLGPSASSVLSWVDGHRSVREIATACRMNVSETLSILDDLRVDGVIVLGGELDA